jgi:hypothetical protein
MRCRASTDLADAPIRAALRFNGSMCCSIQRFFGSRMVLYIVASGDDRIDGRAHPDRRDSSSRIRWQDRNLLVKPHGLHVKSGRTGPVSGFDLDGISVSASLDLLLTLVKLAISVFSISSAHRF